MALICLRWIGLTFLTLTTQSSCRFDFIADAPDLFLSGLDSVDIHSNSWGPLVCGERAISGKRRFLQECIFSQEHPDSPCEICSNFASSAYSVDCEDAVSKYCSRNYEADPIACTFPTFSCLFYLGEVGLRAFVLTFAMLYCLPQVPNI